MGLTKISTDGVKDDAITKAKIPANQIEASELADNSVDSAALIGDCVIGSKIADSQISTEHIVDEAVTLAKLPHGDANNDGKFLRANNGADPSFETIAQPDLTNLSASNLTSGTVPDARFPATLPAISGANLTNISTDFVKISSTTMSGEASEFDLTFDNSTYSQFKLYICGLNLSFDANLYVRFRVGTTFITASNYYGGTIKKYAGGFDSNTYGGQHQSYGYLSDNVGGNDATYERWSGIIDILCGNSGGMPFLRHDSFYKSAASNHVNTMGIVGYQNWSVLSGIRVYASSGNINHGKFELYGVK